MKKKSVKHLLHFMLLCMPLILLLIACIFPTKQINNTYAVEETTTTETETTIYYNQIMKLINSNNYRANQSSITFEDNQVNVNYTNAVADYVGFYNTTNNTPTFTKDHYYYIGYSYNISKNISAFGLNIYNGNQYIINTSHNVQNTNNEFVKYTIKIQALNDSTETQTFFFGGNGWEVGDNYSVKDLFCIDLTLAGIDSLSKQDLDKLFPLNYYPYSQGQEITLNTLTITNNVGNDAQAPLQSYETKQPNEAILMPYKTFYSLEVNNWYRSLLELIGVDISSTDFVQGYLLYFPLWAMWFWLFELIELAVTLVPKLVYEIYTKLSRSKDE